MPQPRRISRPFLLGLAAGAIGGLILVLVIARWRWGDPTPQLTFKTYLAALDQWNKEAPKNYDLEVKVQGTQPATYFVQVRNGEARSAFRNQKYLPQKRSHDTWSVDGMFATLAQDVKRMQAGDKDGTGPPFLLRVEFDSRYGYPAHYHRSEYSSPMEVVWDVVKFEPLAEGAEWSEEYPAKDGTTSQMTKDQ